MKIVVTQDTAFVELDGENIADITLIGGLATMMFGDDVTAKQSKLAARQDATLRRQAVNALANDYCPPHLKAGKLAMQIAVQERRPDAGQLCDEHFAARWIWARQVAPTLEVERRA